MKRIASWLYPAAALALAVAMLAWVFSVRLGGGDAFPEYSSFRADALGTRALYEALEVLPGVRAERELKPLERLGAQPRLLVLPGLDWRDWQEVREDQLAALHAVAANGGTVVLAFRPARARDLETEDESADEDGSKDRKKSTHKKKPGAPAKKDAAKEARKKSDPAKKDEGAKDPKDKDAPRRAPGQAKEAKTKPLAEAWGVELKFRWLMPPVDDATRAATAPATLTEKINWHSDLHFKPKAESGWRVVYARGAEPVVVERAVGRGRVVLLGDAFHLSNEAMQRARPTALLAWLLSDHARVGFAESVLGLEEETGVGYLARRYGLGGALALLVLLGLLHLWRRAVPFYPMRDDLEVRGELALRHEPAAGITALLRRALGAGQVLPACVAEWRTARRAGGNAAAGARFEAAWEARDPRAPAATTYNALARALKPR